MLKIKNSNAVITEIYDELWLKKNISLSLLRLDLIHPVISGNKIFKLSPFLQRAIELNKKIITFGGAYSNHLAATALACRNYNIPCVGIVRGERSTALSATLSYCEEHKMHLEFISRNAYRQKENKNFYTELQTKFGDHILIPEGGFSEEGAKGAAEIYKHLHKNYTHVCCPAGTATTLAGLIQAADPSKQIVGFSALKELNFEERIRYLLKDKIPQNYCLIKDYYFGGFAKKTNELIAFMNGFYQDHHVPLDFVYTGKMMYGVIDLLKQNYFAENSSIVCIHTGGLQGNCSLMPGVLKY